MTKKDYELAANFINRRAERGENVDTLIDFCSNFFWTDNPNFQPEKFKVACLTGKHIRKAIKGV